MHIYLPDINTNATEWEQIQKIREEAREVMTEFVAENRMKTLAEELDLVQAVMTHWKRFYSDGEIEAAKIAHIQKLRARGVIDD